MLKLLMFTLLAVTAYGIPTKHGTKVPTTKEHRIIGGTEAVAGQFPYMVSLKENWFDEHFCGGTILNEYWVLTAAHCVYELDAEDFIVEVGSHVLSVPGQRYNVSKKFFDKNMHPMYYDLDIALLKLKSPIVFNNLVQPIPLSAEEIGVGEDAVLSGWGNINLNGDEPDNLLYLNLKTIDNWDCWIAHSTPVYENNICTLTKAGEGACFGDSGGPLVRDGKLIGVVNWGKPCGVGYPDVFARVSYFLEWINRVMEEN